MRVLHVYRTYFPDTQGGLEEVIRQICHNTKALDVESRIFTLSVNPEPAVLSREEAEVHRFKRSFEIASCGVSIGALKGFKELVAWADVVHYHFPWPFSDLLHFLGRVRKPSVVTYHSDIVRQQNLLKLYAPLMRKFLNSVDVIVATSKNYFLSSHELHRAGEKIEIVPIGLNEEMYPRTALQHSAWAQNKAGDIFFLFIGVLRYYKGLNFLLEALQGTELKCAIAGSGPIENELKQQAARLNLRNVKFLGQIDDIEKVALLKQCRAVVFPSHLRSEAFGVTLVEGAMYGKPLISAEIGTGTSFINIDGLTGFVVPPADPIGLREAMLQLHRDKDLAQSMGRAARRRFEVEFTGQLMGQRYAAIYEKLATGKL